MAPADAAAHLVQLGQAEMVGIVHDNRIGVSHVQPILYQTGAQEHVVSSFVKIKHDLLQQRPCHLAVGDADGNIRQQGLQLVLHRLDGFDAVVDEKYLSAPPLFTHDCVADDTGVVLRHIGLHRQAVCRRRLDNAHFPQVDQGHVQRPGNRRRAQGQHVDIGGPGLPFFLLGHAETLLFVDDEQA